MQASESELREGLRNIGAIEINGRVSTAETILDTMQQLQVTNNFFFYGGLLARNVLLRY